MLSRITTAAENKKTYEREHSLEIHLDPPALSGTKQLQLGLLTDVR
jgi:hypothetical protein